MEISGIANLASSLAEQRTDQEVAVTVFKKALQIQASTASVLLDALPPVTPANLRPNLGQTINTTA